MDPQIANLVAEAEVCERNGQNRLAALLRTAAETIQQLNAEKETILQNAVQMLGSTCEPHAEAIRGMSLSEYIAHPASTCAFCLQERVARLEAEQSAIASTLHLERDDEDSPWWLPAEPGPIECMTVPEAVQGAVALADQQIRQQDVNLERATQALEQIRYRTSSIRTARGIATTVLDEMRDSS